MNLDGYDLENQHLNSMLEWFPAVKDAAMHLWAVHGIQVPQTTIVEIDSTEQIYGVLDGEPPPEWNEHEYNVWHAVKQYPSPCFLRTDLLAAKHNFLNSCYVKDEYSITRSMVSLVEAHAMSMNLPIPLAFVVREFVQLKHHFTAFDGLPIAKERRYFVEGMRTVCHHAYWPKEAIINPEPENSWSIYLKDLNAETVHEIDQLSRAASTIGVALEKKTGYRNWSLDFAQDIAGVWWFIDAAIASTSWHPEH